MQRSATSCFAKHIAAFLVRPFGEYPAFLVLTALLPLVPDIIRFFLNEMSFVPGRNLFYSQSGSPKRSIACLSCRASASSRWLKVFC